MNKARKVSCVLISIVVNFCTGIVMALMGSLLAMLVVSSHFIDNPWYSLSEAKSTNGSFFCSSFMAGFYLPMCVLSQDTP